MAFAFVKQTNLQNGSAASQTFTVSSTAGNTLVAVVVNGGTAFALNGLTDSAGNTWAKRADANNTWAPECSVWSVVNAAAITSLTVALGSAQLCSVSVLEVAGGGAATFDGVGGAGSSTTTSTTGGAALTPTSGLAGDLVVAGVGVSSTAAQTFAQTASGWTLAANLGGSSTKLPVASAYKLSGLGTSNASTFTWTNGGSYNTATVAFQAGALAPFPPFPPHVSPVYRM